MSTKTDQLRQIRDEVLVLNQSPLYKERVKNKVFPVIGEGSHDARIMLIGEAPGRNEAATGKPFCGAAGKILDQLLASVGIDRKDIYITNIVKDRPPFNRDPLPDEIEIYGPFLDRQINIIQPEVIATLGRFSMDYIMRRFDLLSDLGPISKLHGKAFNGTASFGPVTIIPLYHPAVAIYNQSSKDILMQDVKILKKYN
jgi:DNA polymerase